MISQRAKDENTMDASWKLYDAERMANESLRQQLAHCNQVRNDTMLELERVENENEEIRKQLEVMSKAPHWATYTKACGHIADLRQQLADQKAYYEQVMADGGKRIKDLMEQNESLRKANKECVEYFNEAQKELAARHLREQRYREFVEEVRRTGDTRLASMAIANLSMPTNPSALEAMIAKAGEVMREEVIEQCIAMGAMSRNGAFVEEIRALPGVTLEDLQQ